jgi:hypothetical protein
MTREEKKTKQTVKGKVFFIFILCNVFTVMDAGITPGLGSIHSKGCEIVH